MDHNSQAIDTDANEHVAIPFEIKNVTKDEHDDEIGLFEGLAAVFGNRDLGDDIIEPGAFTATLKRRHRHPKMFWGHHSHEPPIGSWEELEETDKGLRVKGRLFLEIERSRNVYVGLREKVLNGLSIGFSIAKNGADFDRETGIRRLTKLDLWEISIVNFPMNERARIGNVKTVVGYQNLPLGNRARPWGRTAADRRVRSWASATDTPNAKYRRAFTWYDRENADNFGAYKLQIADIIDGDLVAVPRGVFAVAAVLMGARGGVDIPDADRTGVRRHIARYYAKMRDEFDDDNIVPPWEKMKTDPAGAIADVRRATVDLIDTIRDYECVLREEGHSTEAAKAIAARSFKAIPVPRDEGGGLSWVGEQLAQRAQLLKLIQTR